MRWAEPFGIAPVDLHGRPPAEAERLLAAAASRLDALADGERGRPTLNTGAVSRRTLLSPGGAVTSAPAAMLDERACAGTSRCGLCLDTCPASAIAAGSRVPMIDVNACTGCGRCVPRCPHGALHLSGTSTGQVEAQLAELATGFDGVVLVCAAAEAEVPAGWALVELPTLALVTVGWLLQLHARGLDVALAPCDGPCCAGARAVEELAGRVLERAAVPPRMPPGEIRLGEPAATAEALRLLSTETAAGAIPAAAAPLGLLTLSEERCTLCSACATACPTGALSFDETTEDTLLTFAAAHCVGCGRCVAACPEQALAVERGIDLERLVRGTVELVRDARERCSACGAELPPRPMRRRLRELVPRYADAPLELCAGCAARAPASESHTIPSTS